MLSIARVNKKSIPVLPTPRTHFTRNSPWKFNFAVIDPFDLQIDSQSSTPQTVARFISHVMLFLFLSLWPCVVLFVPAGSKHTPRALFLEAEPSLTRPRPIHEILSVTPNWTNSGTFRDVFIRFSPQSQDIHFCRFGNAVVRGVLRPDGLLRCQTPDSPPGIVRLSISANGIDFVGDRQFTFLPRQPSMMPYVVISGVVGVLAALAFIRTKTKRQSRQSVRTGVRERRRRYEPAAFL
jgi:hypothetical protein